MSKRWRVCNMVLVLFASLLTIPGSAAAAGNTTTEHYSYTNPITWAMSTARCGKLVADISATGEFSENGLITQFADGSTKYEVTDVAKGDAVDANGNQYKWTYKNQFHATVPAAPNNDRVYVHMSDVFTLTGGGKGATQPYVVGINWRWNYTNQGDVPPFAGSWPPERDLETITSIGDFTVIPTGLDCDPI